ncbi:MAG: ribosome maturation factor RimP [Sterolibacterium sp.]|nr:ribosome maturation factor RimP [Sterolibacterium sp.]
MQLLEHIEHAVSGLGYELVDFETTPRARLLRVFIDRPEGITVDDCAAVSNHLTRLFTVENIDYDRLEVSSPGLDRPLKKVVDFERFAGQEAQVRMRLPIAGRRNFSGVLRGVRIADEPLVLLQGEGSEQSFELPLAQIDKARLVPKF